MILNKPSKETRLNWIDHGITSKHVLKLTVRKTKSRKIKKYVCNNPWIATGDILKKTGLSYYRGDELVLGDW